MPYGHVCIMIPSQALRALVTELPRGEGQLFASHWVFEGDAQGVEVQTFSCLIALVVVKFLVRFQVSVGADLYVDFLYSVSVVLLLFL